MKRSSEPHRTAELSKSLHQQLNAYAIAAGAAGVGMLALTQPASAKIVYTPANISIVNHFKLDLNNDDQADFGFSTSLFEKGTSTGTFRLNVYPVGAKNRIWGTAQYASALRAGVRVGSNEKKFQEGHYVMGVWKFHAPSSTTYGQWPKVRKGYLGLKFFIKGEVHYGWARIEDALTLTGYAYETIPNKPIVTGDRKGLDDELDVASLPVSAPKPATLGLLALGSPGLSIWRREQSVGTRG
jgi:hypothetical protein